MVVVFIVDKVLDLHKELFSLTRGKYLKTYTVWQGHLFLQYIQPAVDNDESKFAVQKVRAQVLKAALIIIIIFLANLVEG